MTLGTVDMDVQWTQTTARLVDRTIVADYNKQSIMMPPMQIAETSGSSGQFVRCGHTHACTTTSSDNDSSMGAE